MVLPPRRAGILEVNCMEKYRIQRISIVQINATSRIDKVAFKGKSMFSATTAPVSRDDNSN